MNAPVLPLVNSKWTDSIYSGGWKKTNTTADIIEPANGNNMGRTGVASTDDVRKAAAAAAKAQPAWEKTSFEQRAKIIRKVAQLMEERAPEIISWVARETGATPFKAAFEHMVSMRAVMEAAAMPSQSRGEILPTEHCRLSLARRRALGVVGVISPFNFPLFLSIRAISPALAVGNTVLVKPNPFTTVSGGFLIAQLYEDAGLPPDVLHVLPGGPEVGESFCDDPNVNMIQFTGSTAVGRKVGEVAGKHLKKVSLEMGGKSSLIVLEDADIELATSAAGFASFMHQGQICFAAGRTLVHRKIVDKFVERFTAKAKAIKVGDPSKDQVLLGPVISKVQVERVNAIVQESISQGAKLATGGTYKDLFYQPTILTGVTSEMRCYKDEIFGPVASIIPFDTDEEAIKIANDTEYGLSCGIITKSIGRALAMADLIKSGIIHINDQTVGEEVVNPISGWGSSGNGTGIGGPANWDEFSQWQWVTIKDEPPPYPI